jgi:hypothetical protein
MCAYPRDCMRSNGRRSIVDVRGNVGHLPFGPSRDAGVGCRLRDGRVDGRGSTRLGDRRMTGILPETGDLGALLVGCCRRNRREIYNAAGVLFQSGLFSVTGSEFAGNGANGLESAAPLPPTLANNIHNNYRAAARSRGRSTRWAMSSPTPRSTALRLFRTSVRLRRRPFEPTTPHLPLSPGTILKVGDEAHIDVAGAIDCRRYGARACQHLFVPRRQRWRRHNNDAGTSVPIRGHCGRDPRS